MHLPGGVEDHPVEEEYSRLPNEVITHLEAPAMPVSTVDRKDILICNCPCCQNRTGTANLIDLDDDEYFIEPEPSDPVNKVCTRLEALTIDQQSQLAKDMGIKEDFPTA